MDIVFPTHTVMIILPKTEPLWLNIPVTPTQIFTGLDLVVEIKKRLSHRRSRPDLSALRFRVGGDTGSIIGEWNGLGAHVRLKTPAHHCHILSR